MKLGTLTATQTLLERAMSEPVRCNPQMKVAPGWKSIEFQLEPIAEEIFESEIHRDE